MNAKTESQRAANIALARLHWLERKQNRPRQRFIKPVWGEMSGHWEKVKG
jgi:hypothetical protein